MKLTTKGIIKILPFEKDFKTDLLQSFDTLTPDQKFTIEQMVWDTYYAIFKLRLEYNTEMALERAKNNQEKLDKDFYKRVREQTEKEIQSESMQAVEETDLTLIRNKIQVLINKPS